MSKYIIGYKSTVTQEDRKRILHNNFLLESALLVYTDFKVINKENATFLSVDDIKNIGISNVLKNKSDYYFKFD
jgi:hypothetical protein